MLTFRGNHLRNAPAWGRVPGRPTGLTRVWAHSTTSGTREWGGGFGWTGQPVLVQWPDTARASMNLDPTFSTTRSLVEVIAPSLDTRVYFFDLVTGKPTRKPLELDNPVKGSCAVDPRGWPVLYVGDGIPETVRFGHVMLGLVDLAELAFLDGEDSWAFSRWGAFDGAPLINRSSDELVLVGENGLFYRSALHTRFDPAARRVSISPETTRCRYLLAGNRFVGAENSIAAWRHLAFFADNGGSIVCVDLTRLAPVWWLRGTDDTDATIVVDVEGDRPFLYTGCEVDKQGASASGSSHLLKIDALTGRIVWKTSYRCQTVRGEKAINGGLLATPAVGKHAASRLVVFTLSHCPTLHRGLMVALDKATGQEVWRRSLGNYAWSSPVDFYDPSGEMYLLQCDAVGHVMILDGRDGRTIASDSLNATIEASPAVFDDRFVIGTRDARLHGYRIETQSGCRASPVPPRSPSPGPSRQ